MANVSIVMPCYNCSQFIQEAIASVVAQTYSKWELIIVDDCSTDESVEIAKKNSLNDPRIKIFRQEARSGPAVARNTAIELATGRYIAFLDSDDMWLPEKLEKQLQLMENHSAVFSYTGYEKIDVSGRRSGRYVSVPEVGYYKDILAGCFIGCLTAVYDAKALGKLYMPNIKRAQDFGLWLHILRQGHMALGLNEVLALYRERPGSISSSKVKKAYYQWRVYRDLEQLSFVESVKFFGRYGLKGIRKKMI